MCMTWTPKKNHFRLLIKFRFVEIQFIFFLFFSVTATQCNWMWSCFFSLLFERKKSVFFSFIKLHCSAHNPAMKCRHQISTQNCIVYARKYMDPGKTLWYDWTCRAIPLPVCCWMFETMFLLVFFCVFLFWTHKSLHRSSES
jgi:hypothetical protein